MCICYADNVIQNEYQGTGEVSDIKVCAQAQC